MDDTLRLNAYLFPMIILAIIYISMRRDHVQSTEKRMFQTLLAVTFLLLLTELLSWNMDGQTFPFARNINWLLNVTNFFLIPFLSLAWMNMAWFYQYHRRFWKEWHIWQVLIILPITVYYVILLSSIWTHSIFSINEQNYYTRGTLYFLPYLIVELYLAAVALLFGYWSRTQGSANKRIQNRMFMIYTIIPIAGGIFQFRMYQMWFSLPITTIAEILIYINLQNTQITLDSLTELYNRGRFEHFYQQLRRQAEDESESSWYLFVMDLDDFKRINDEYGHITGDRALEDAAALIAEVFSTQTAFVARYGGDEFCVLEVCRDDAQAEAYIEKVHNAFAVSRQTGTQPYTLKISVGYACMSQRANENEPEEPFKRADQMMYENKRRGRME